MHQRLNIITDYRADRAAGLKEQIQLLNITNYKFWDAVKLPSVKASINAAHKQIVRYAKIAEFGEVMIAEDDFRATHPDSFRYFLSQKPPQYDLYLSQVYLGDIDERGRVKGFTGLTLYFVSARYYDRFLSSDPTEHLDIALNNVGGDFHVCQPFPFIQANGWSSNTGKHENYDSLLANRKLFGG